MDRIRSGSSLSLIEYFYYATASIIALTMLGVLARPDVMARRWRDLDGIGLVREIALLRVNLCSSGNLRSGRLGRTTIQVDVDNEAF